MKKTSLMMWLFLSLIVPWATHAQGLGADAPIYTCNFEESSNVGEWLFGPATTQTNQWVIGKCKDTRPSMYQFSDTKPNNHALFITNDDEPINGAYNYLYTVNQTSFSYACHPVAIQTGSQFRIKYSVNIAGLDNHAGLRVFLAPRDADMSKLSSKFFSQLPSGFISLDGGQAITNIYNRSSFTLKDVTATVANGGQYNLVFCWYNGTTASGINPPAAIDDIQCFYTPACILASDLEPTKDPSTISTFKWNWDDDQASTYKYQYLYGLAGFTPTQADWSNADTCTSSSSTGELSIYALRPFTYYDLYVRPVCSNSDPTTSAIRFITDPNPIYNPNSAIYATTFEYKGNKNGLYSDKDKWYFVHSSSAANHWVIDAAAITALHPFDALSGDDISGKSVDNKSCLYITNGTTSHPYAYTTDNAPASNAYSVAFAVSKTPISFETNNANVSYDWCANGEYVGYPKDYLRLFLVPIADTNCLRALARSYENNNFSNTFNEKVSAGWVALDNGIGLYGSNALQRDTFAIAPVANTKYALVVAWVNDSRDGNQYPAAVDNIIFTKAQSCNMPLISKVATDAAKNTVTFSWTNVSTSSYQCFFAPVGQMPDWNTVTVLPDTTKSAKFNFSDTYSSYEFFIRSFCSDNEQSTVVRVPFTSPMTGVDCTAMKLSFNETNVKANGDSILFGNKSAQSKVFMVFDKDELNAAITTKAGEKFNGQIKGMSFQLVQQNNSRVSADVNFKVYLDTIPLLPDHQPYGVLQPEEMSLVFDGSRHFENIPEYNWNELVFDNPFDYDANYCLAVLIVRDEPIEFSTTDSNLYFATSNNPLGGADARCYVYNSKNQPNGWYRWGRPVTRFAFCSDYNGCDKPVDAVSTFSPVVKNNAVEGIKITFNDSEEAGAKFQFELINVVDNDTIADHQFTSTCTKKGNIKVDSIGLGTGDNQIPYNFTFNRYRVRRICSPGVYSNWTEYTILSSITTKHDPTAADIVNANLLDDDHIQIGKAVIDAAAKTVTITYRKGFESLSHHCDIAFTVSKNAKAYSFYTNATKNTILPNASDIYYITNVNLTSSPSNTQCIVVSENGSSKKTWKFYFTPECVASPLSITANYDEVKDTIFNTITLNPRVAGQNYVVKYSYKYDSLVGPSNGNKTLVTFTKEQRDTLGVDVTEHFIANPLPGANYVVSAYAYNVDCTSDSVFADTVKVPVRDCVRPSVSTNAIGLYDASFSWEPTSAASYRYILRDNTGRVISAGDTDDTIVSFDNLHEYTNYALTVQGHCYSANPRAVSPADTVRFTTQARCIPPVIDDIYMVSKSVVHVEWHNGSVDANGVASQPNHFNYGIALDPATDLSWATDDTATSADFQIPTAGDTYKFAVQNVCYLTDGETLLSPVADTTIETDDCLWPHRDWVWLSQRHSNSLQLKFSWIPRSLAEESDNLELLVIPDELAQKIGENVVTLNTLAPTYSNVSDNPFYIDQALGQRLERNTKYRVYYRPICSDSWDMIRYKECTTPDIDPCPAVENLTLDYLGVDSAAFSWNESTAQFFSSYTVVLAKNGPGYFPEFVSSATISDNHIGFGNLDTNQSYTIKVYTNCNEFNSEDQTSAVVTLPFTTQSVCNRPIDIKVSNITSNSAVLSWNPGNADSNHIKIIQNDLSGVTPIDTIINTADYTDNGIASFTLSGLRKNTSYIITLSTLCSNEFFYAAPFEVRANDGDYKNRTFTTKNSDADFKTFTIVSNEPNVEHDAIIPGVGSDPDTIHFLLPNGAIISPAFINYTLTNESMNSKVYLNGRRLTRNFCVVDLTQAPVFTVVAQDTNIKHYYVVDFDFESCTKPQQLKVKADLFDHAELSWYVPTDDSRFRVVVYANGDNDNQDSIVQYHDNVRFASSGYRTYEINPLIKGHSYKAVVYTICGNDISESAQVPFTISGSDPTNPCTAPTDLVITDPSDHEATLSWTASTAEHLLNYSYGYAEKIDEENNKYGDTTWANTNLTTVTVSGLKDLATYRFFVMANCPTEFKPDFQHSDTVKNNALIQTACPSFLSDNEFDKERISRQSVRIAWNWNYVGDYRYLVDTAKLDSAKLANASARYQSVSNDRQVTLDNLIDTVPYYFYISRVCSNGNYGNWDTVKIDKFNEGCPVVSDVDVAATPYAATFVISTDGTLDENPTWHLQVDRINGNHKNFFKDTISDPIFTVTGLEPQDSLIATVGYYCNGVITKTVQREFNTFVCTEFADEKDAPETDNVKPFGTTNKEQRHAYIYSMKDDENLVAGTINSLSWRVNGGVGNNVKDTVAIYVKKLAPVEDTFCAADKLIWSTMISDATLVFADSLKNASISDDRKVVTFEFDDPITISNDSNLMVLVYSNDKGSLFGFSDYKLTEGRKASAYLNFSKGTTSFADFVPFSVNGGGLSNVRPATTFCIIPSECQKVNNLGVVHKDANSVTIAWTPGNNHDEESWVVALDSIQNVVDTTDKTFYTFNGLVSGTEHKFFVRPAVSRCEEAWNSITSSTETEACKVSNVSASAKDDDTWTLSFTKECNEVVIATTQWNNATLQFDTVTTTTTQSSFDFVRAPQAHEYFYTIIPFCNGVASKDTVRGSYNDNDCGIWTVTDNTPYHYEFNEANLNCWSYAYPELSSDIMFELPAGGSFKAAFSHNARRNTVGKFVVNAVDAVDTVEFNSSRDMAYTEIDLNKYAGQTISLSFVNTNFWAQQSIKDVRVFTTKKYDLTVNVNDATMGAVSPAGTQSRPAGYVQLNATPANNGYMFVNWTNQNNDTLSDDAAFSFFLSDNTSLTANFAPRTSRIITGVAAGYELIGAVDPTKDTLLPFDSTFTITATANEGYRFDHWNDGVTDNRRTITVGVNNASYYAYFQNEVTHSYQDLTVCDSFNYVDLEGISHVVTESNEDVTVPVRVSSGVDSVHINLTVNYTATDTTEQTACNAYRWDGNTFTESGNYSVRFNNQAANGCDSVATLVLTIHKSVTTDTFATVCDRFDWYEHPAITASCNNLTHTLTDQFGCDSILRLNLTVNYSVADTEAVTACDSYNWNGIDYPSNGAYTQHFIAANGCDSLHTINLSIVKHFTTEMAATACDSYTWRNETYTRSGVYHQVFEGQGVCDTFATLHLTINYSTTADTFAAACNSFSWYEHTNITASTDTCKHLFHTVNDCDSLVTLHLTVNTSDTTRTSHVACASYTWNGVTYTTSGVKEQTLSNVYGCDSVVFLNLTINPVYNDTIDREACVSYTWNDQTYTVSGLYTQEFTSINGCDSIRTINLTVKPNIYNQVSATACVSYTWNEETYEESGVYTQTFNPASNGCDSIVTLTLTINQPVAYEFEATDCDSYTWNTETYTTSGDYVQTFRAANNCDSVVTLHLTVNYSDNTEFSATACDSYTWNNVTYTTSGDFTQHFNTINGCDSTVVLHLTINNSVNNAFSATACDSYTWNNETYTTSGDKVQVLQTSKGCDSTVVLHLTINNSYAVSTSATACDSYTWNNQTYNTTGSYVQTLRAANGCDSVVTLALTVNYSANTEFNATACDSYTWNGQTYATSGNYTQHFTTVNGCDSTVVLHLTINRSYYGEISRVACVSYSWYGVTYTQSGNYRHIGTTPQGCDSIIDLHLTINQPVQSSNTVVACESYTWAASHETYTVSGDYQVTIANGAVNGCDSTAVLHLTINHGTHNAATQTACLSFNWHGVEYTRSGDYTYNYVNDLNCNSTDTLHLTVIPMQGSASAVTACESYSWNDVTYTTSGTYYHDYVLDGCPAKDTLVLTVNYGSHNASSVVECDIYIWNGIPYTSTGTYLYNYTNELGCPSVDTLHLTINPSTSSVEVAQTYTTYTWNGNTYSASGEYSVHFVNQYGCDSTATLQLTVIPLGFPTPVIRLRDNKSLVVDHYPTGNEYIPYIAYRWYRDGELIVNDTDDTYMNVDGSDLDGHYYVMVPVDDQRSAWVASNVITVGREGVDDIDNSEFTLTVAPNPVLAGSVVNISTDLTTERLQGATCTIWDINGRAVWSESMTQASITINADLTAGTYTVEVRTSDGSRLVQRLVVVR